MGRHRREGKIGRRHRGSDGNRIQFSREGRQRKRGSATLAGQGWASQKQFSRPGPHGAGAGLGFAVGWRWSAGGLEDADGLRAGERAGRALLSVSVSEKTWAGFSRAKRQATQRQRQQQQPHTAWAVAAATLADAATAALVAAARGCGAMVQAGDRRPGTRGRQAGRAVAAGGAPSTRRRPRRSRRPGRAPRRGSPTGTTWPVDWVRGWVGGGHEEGAKCERAVGQRTAGQRTEAVAGRQQAACRLARAAGGSPALADLQQPQPALHPASQPAARPTCGT